MSEEHEPLQPGDSGNPPLRVHHVNLLVRDLEVAMDSYRRQLGVLEFVREDLPGRGVRTARFAAGESWIVLVQPVAEGEPMRQLRERGEGLFLLSLGFADLEGAMARVVAGGGALTSTEPRSGLCGWQVIDVAPETLHGGHLQLTNVTVPAIGVT
jgi:methylmalonyl-CoA/ethylmalonyl-CoA epimerase